MSAKNGGPAFPHEYGDAAPGMTLRDYFAAKAMAALITAQGALDADDENSVSWGLTCGTGAKLEVMRMSGENFTWEGMLSDNAYGIADAMLAERAK